MSFKIIGADEHVYGPIPLETLRDWVGENRVDGQTWVYDDAQDTWNRAATIPGLADVFPNAAATTSAEKVARNHPNLQPAHLRRLSALTDMNEDQLIKFVQVVESVQYAAFRPVVKKDEYGDSMFLILSGEVRVTAKSEDGRETTLAIMESGNFFGEICLFQPGPRSADVTATRDSVLLKISQVAFQGMMLKHPDVAARFLFAVIRIVESRVQAINKKYLDSMTFARSWGQIPGDRPGAAPPSRNRKF